MKTKIIKAVKHYSKVMIDKDIEVKDGFEFVNCRTSSIDIVADYELKFFVNIEYESLKKLSNSLFGFVNEELIEDLQKELANTIGGYFADNFFDKGYKLGLPKIEEICDTKHNVFFENDILKLSIRLKVI